MRVITVQTCLLGIALAVRVCCGLPSRPRRQSDVIHLVVPDEPSTSRPPIKPSSTAVLDRSIPTCPVNEDNLTTFIRMGHVGGDPKEMCENTVEAGRAGLAKGLNAFEVDLCMSSDGVVFLWHDCDMSEFTARMRQFGTYAINEDCLPYRDPSVYGRSPSTLTYDEIRKHFGYKKSWNKNDRISAYIVPTLREYLVALGQNKAVERFYLDVKMPHAASPQKLVNNALAIGKEFGIEHKMLFSFPTVDQVQSAIAQIPVFSTPGGTKARLLLGLGIDPEDVITTNSYLSNLDSAEGILRRGLSKRYSLSTLDRWRIRYHITMVKAKIYGSAALSIVSIWRKLQKKLVPVKAAQRLCLPYVSVRYFRQLTTYFGDPYYKSIMSKAFAERQSSGYPVKILSSNINDSDMVQWLRNQGVDGIMTDYPHLLQ